MLQLGDDKWSLAGTTKIPKQRPEIVCRYGWVRSGDTGAVVARAVAFQLYDRYAYYILTPVWPPEPTQWSDSFLWAVGTRATNEHHGPRLFWADRSSVPSKSAMFDPRAGVVGISAPTTPLAAAAKVTIPHSQPPIMMEQAEQLLRNPPAENCPGESPVCNLEIPHAHVPG